MTSYARCDPGSRPLSPDDRAVLETFRIWLAMDEADRALAVRLDPAWQLFVLGLPLARRQESRP